MGNIFYLVAILLVAWIPYVVFGPHNYFSIPYLCYGFYFGTLLALPLVNFFGVKDSKWKFSSQIAVITVFVAASLLMIYLYGQAKMHPYMGVEPMPVVKFCLLVPISIVVLQLLRALVRWFSLPVARKLGIGQFSSEGTGYPDWVKVAMVAMAFTIVSHYSLVLFASYPLHTVRQKLAWFLGTWPGWCFIAVYAVAMPILILERVERRRYRFLAGTLYFLWLTVLLKAAFFSMSDLFWGGVAVLIAGYAAGFLGVYVWMDAPNEWSAFFKVRKRTIAISIVLLLVATIVIRYDPLELIKTGNLARARAIRMLTPDGYEGKRFGYSCVALGPDENTRANLLDLPKGHGIDYFEIYDHQPHLSYSRENLSEVDSIHLYRGSVSPVQVTPLLGCKFIHLFDIRYPDCEVRIDAVQSISIYKLATNDLNRLLKSLDPAKPGGWITIKETDMDEESWRQVSRLADRVKFYLAVNKSVVDSSGARTRALDDQIELSFFYGEGTPEERIELRNRLAIQSEMSVQSIYSQESENLWELIWAAQGWKKLGGVSPGQVGRDQQWYCGARRRFFEVAEQWGWVYGDEESRRYYLPLESPYTLFQLCGMPGNERILQARSISFLGQWTNTEVSVWHTDDPAEKVFPQLEELYLDVTQAAGKPWKIEVMAPNLKLLHFAPCQKLSIAQLAKHPTLEHMIVSGTADFKELAALSRMPSLKKLTLTSDGLIGAGDGLNEQLKRLRKLLPGIEIEVVPDATHLAPPEHFVRHHNKMRESILKKKGLPLEK